MTQPMYPFEVYICKDNGKMYWAAKSASLRGCVGQGETALDAINEMTENEREWLKSAGEAGIPIPEIPVVSSDACNCDNPLEPNLTETNFSIGTNSTSVSFDNVSTKSTLHLVYKSVTTVMQYDEENEILYGKLENVPGDIYYYGNSVDEAEKEFHQKVDEYYETL